MLSIVGRHSSGRLADSCRRPLHHGAALHAAAHSSDTIIIIITILAACAALSKLLAAAAAALLAASGDILVLWVATAGYQPQLACIRLCCKPGISGPA